MLGNLFTTGGRGGGGGGGGSTIGSAASSFGIAMPDSLATSTDIFKAMLKSRVMADAVIRQFNLDMMWAKSMGDARRALAASTKISVEKDKTLKIVVEANDPQLAADIANFYVTNLDRMNRTVNITKAGQSRAFLERRLAETKVILTQKEGNLKEFQVKNKTFAIEQQAQVMMQTAAMTHAQIMSEEVQLEVLKTYLSPDNPEMVRVRSGLDELRKQLSVMVLGKDQQGELTRDGLHASMTTVPVLTLDFARAMRDLKLQENLYALLISQYEQAKLAEARDIPTVQVLDLAIPAEMKSRPKITENMMIAGAVSIVIGIALAFSLELVGRFRAQQNSRLPYRRADLPSQGRNGDEADYKVAEHTGDRAPQEGQPAP